MFPRRYIAFKTGPQARFPRTVRTQSAKQRDYVDSLLLLLLLLLLLIIFMLHAAATAAVRIFLEAIIVGARDRLPLTLTALINSSPLRRVVVRFHGASVFAA